MKLYIWEGGGISTGYHDDGTLIVLAESPEQARALAKESALIEPTYDGEDYDRWTDGMHRTYSDAPDVPNPAIGREPDRIVDVDVARVVSFNGGGYD
jgi:hypothetical protein